MIEERGEVTGVEPPYALVVTQRRSSCGSCSTKGCGTGALSELFAARSQAMKVLNPIDARVGEQVVLGLEEGVLLRGSLAVYIVPLLTMIGGGIVGEAIAPSLALAAPEYLALPAAFAGLSAGFLWVRRFGRRLSSEQRFMAVILRRAEMGPLQQATPVTWRGR
ncbi:MAG TPA: SoxR reducing system RseC family protein [Gammaproteobacteria bacterium]